MHRSLIALFLLCACSKDVGIVRVDDRTWYDGARRNVLSSDDVSDVTRHILRRRGLFENYRRDPRSAIDALQAELRETRQRELTVAIAELAVLQTKRVSTYDPVANGTALRYAYAYLFDTKLLPRERTVFDAQFRWASDLYNAAIAERVRNVEVEEVSVRQRGVLRWYGGEAAYTIETEELQFELKAFETARITRDYRVANLPRPDVRRGFGVPVVLRSSWDRETALARKSQIAKRYLPPALAVSATVVLRFPDGSSVIDESHKPGVVHVIDATTQSTIDIEGEAVPIEYDFVTPLAAMLSKLQQSLGIAALRRGDRFAKQGGLYMFRPHRPGRIPVLLIHGLASDPYTWLPLYADLLSNDTIRTRCEFMFWFYPTGQPILQSAAQLRGALVEARQVLDPDYEVPELEWAVICGHSMGGILARSMTYDSGNALWDVAFDRSPDELDIDEETRELLREAFFFKAFPGVRRAIFFATPHRGSPQADTWLARLGESLVFVPRSIADPGAKLVRSGQTKLKIKNVTSFWGLRPDNPVLKAALTRPIAPHITYHSIIGDNLRAGATNGTDGYVPYWSSHLEGAASEVVLLSGHSVQQTPQAARETRRILLEHIAAFDAAQAAKK